MGLVVILLCLVAICVKEVSCESTNTITYSVAILENTLYTDPIINLWTLERNIWNEVLFFWPEADENHDSDASLMTVSNKRLSDSEFHSSFNAWKSKRQTFDYLRLSCASTEDHASVCICTKYYQSEESILRSIPAEATNSSDWVRASMFQCNSLPPLTSKVFRDFRRLTLLELDMVHLNLVEVDAFRDLNSLEFFRLSNYSTTTGAMLNGTLCGLETLFAVEIYDNGYNNGGRPNNFLPFLQCGSSNSIRAHARTRRNLACIIDIKNTSLSRIQKDTFASFIPSHFLVLFLQNNMITDIEEDSFVKLRMLVQLDVSENQLSFLRPSAFNGLIHLYELNLAFNRLEAINVAVFEKLPSLTGLNLYGNPIMHLEGRFGHLPNLITLDLGSNRLTSVDAITFAGSGSLMKLWLDFNEISTINQNAFTNCQFLWFIDLTGNRLGNPEYIRRFLQYKVNSLGVARLSMNNISTILPNTFSQNPGWQPFVSFDMDSSQVKTIHKDAFTNSPDLIQISLQNNTLTYLHPDTFKTNSYLWSVFLSDNCLASIPAMSDTLEYLYIIRNCIRRLPLFNKTMQNLQQLIMYGNPLRNLNKNSFDEFPSLVGLNVSRCDLSSISEDIFF